MYSIRDNAAEIFHPPFFKNTHGEAERDFKMLVNDPKSTLHNFPQHYDLYTLGKYDSTTGLLEPIYPPEFVTRAVDQIDKNLTQIEA